MNNFPLLLIIDDEYTILKTLKDSLQDERYQVETLSDGNMALEKIGKTIPDLILLDIFMPNCNGLELLKKIKKEYPQQKVIIISGFGNIPIAIQAIKYGALDFIEKPLNLDDILSKISFLKEDFKSKNNICNNIDNLENFGIVGQSNLFLELIQQLNCVSKLKLPLLIYGQHGIGKELFANYIHKKSNLNKHNFFSIDCATLTEKEFLKKVIFLFKNNVGTFFIKNIDQLSPNCQNKLLFCMQNFENENIRIIASSCQQIFNLVKDKKFSSCLFHALNSTPLEIPPLNKRRYDIPLLIDYYLNKINKKYEKSVIFNIKSIRILRNHNWESNVCELKNLIEKIVADNTQIDKVITPEILNKYLSEKNYQIIEEQFFTKFNSLKEACQEFEKKFLMHLLKNNQFDIKQLSNRLNLTPLELRDKILKLNLDFKV
ncbi:response regulator [Candidatus Babeliales bacterium]|nr:response regulator [Candidatus Babeliales bacterium]MCF7899271.1 response regulator [Candidatus Babeliales bacterium]